MKYLTAVLFIAILSCNKVDNVGFKGLSDADKAYYLEKAQKQCVTDAQSTFDDLANESSDALFSFPREKKITYTFTGEGYVTTNVFHVWERNENAMFVLQTTLGTVPTYKFIKFTRDSNTALANQLLQTLCKNTDKAIVFTDDLPPTVTKTTFQGLSEDTQTKSDTLIKFSTDHPIFMAAYMQTVTNYVTDLSGNDTGAAPKPYTTVVKDESDIDLPFPSYTQYANAQFCVINAPAVGDTTYPFSASCTTDANVGITGWTSPTPAQDLGTY